MIIVVPISDRHYRRCVFAFKCRRNKCRRRFQTFPYVYVFIRILFLIKKTVISSTKPLESPPLGRFCMWRSCGRLVEDVWRKKVLHTFSGSPTGHAVLCNGSAANRTQCLRGQNKKTAAYFPATAIFNYQLSIFNFSALPLPAFLHTRSAVHPSAHTCVFPH